MSAHTAMWCAECERWHVAYVKYVCPPVWDVQEHGYSDWMCCGVIHADSAQEAAELYSDDGDHEGPDWAIVDVRSTDGAVTVWNVQREYEVTYSASEATP